MKFLELVDQFRDRPFFEGQELALLFDEPAPQTQARLSRWQRQGKLIRLRRGRYLLPEEYRRGEPADFYLANYLYRPSYVSLQSALEFYGMIPEAVGRIFSVTTLHGREWDTPRGAFHYRSIHDDRFWGYREDGIVPPGSVAKQRRFLIASPEKAILDLFYLDPGEWTRDRITGLRLQHLGAIDLERLDEFAARFRSPKVGRAARRLVDAVESASTRGAEEDR